MLKTIRKKTAEEGIKKIEQDCCEAKVREMDVKSVAGEDLSVFEIPRWQDLPESAETWQLAEYGRDRIERPHWPMPEPTN